MAADLGRDERSRKPKQTIKDFMRRRTVVLIILLACFAFSNNLITSVLTSMAKQNVAAEFLLEAISKYLFALLPVFLMIKWNLVSKSGAKQILFGLLLGIPSIIPIAVNIIPLTLLNSSLFQVQWMTILAIVVANFGIGLLEETACRGVVLPLLCEKWADHQNGYMKAAIASSLIFGSAHLSWIINSLVFAGKVSAADCMGSLYQIYLAFCFGMLSAGVTLYTRSILPMVIWHSLVDISSFLPAGILHRTTYVYYYITKPIGFDTVLIKAGIMKRTGAGYYVLLAGLYAISLIAGIILTKRAWLRRKKTEFICEG